MELRKEDIQVLRTKSRATSQVTFDVDYNVPDVKPDIGLQDHLRYSQLLYVYVPHE